MAYAAERKAMLAPRHSLAAFLKLCPCGTLELVKICRDLKKMLITQNLEPIHVLHVAKIRTLDLPLARRQYP